MTKHSILAIFLATFLGATGCGGDDGDAGLAPICNNTDGLYVDLVDGFLDCNMVILDFAFGGRPTRGEISTGCDASFGPHVDDGTVTINADAVAACRASIEASTCESPALGVPGPCDDVLVGTQPDGEVCDDDVQCAGNAFCGAAPGQCGACTARLADGTTCMDGDHCVGRFCNDGGQCASFGQLNDTCMSTDACGGNLVCDSNGSCAATAVVGTACVDSDHCGWPLTGLYCSSSLQCATIQPAGSGCADFFGCNLLAGELCDTGVTDTCLAGTVVGANQECSVIAGTVCDTGFICTDQGMASPTICLPPHNVGDACTGSCNQLFMECVGGLCQYSRHTGMCPAVATAL